MTVTENDIITNAAAIASLVNAADDVTIADLDAVTSLASDNLLHCSVSGVDKNITRDNALKIEGTEVLSTGEAGGTKFLREDGDGTCSWQTPAGGGGGYTEPDPYFSSGNFDYPSANAAPREVINSATITNVTLYGQAFDDTTDESIENSFKIPSDISTTGADTVTFKVVGIAETAAASDVEFRFSHSASGSSDSADVAFTNEDSGAKAVDTTQDDNTYFEWTETITNLTAAGWEAGSMVKFRLTRYITGGNDDLTDDFYVRSLEISIPRD